MGLAELLGNDLGGGIGIQEAVAQDLAHGLVGAAVIGLGAGLQRREGRQAASVEIGQELVITLAAVAVFSSDGADALVQTLTFHEHKEAVGLLIGGWDGQGAGGAGELVSRRIELE